MNTVYAVQSPVKASSPQAEGTAKGPKSILYNVDATGSNEYVHLNNFVPGAKPKRATEDQLSQISKTQRGGGQTAFQKSFLDESKVNKHLARELMNAKPIFSVQEI